MAIPKKKHPGGRPTKMTPQCIHKLEAAYLFNATHLEAAIYAGISESTLHDYLSRNPKFSERIRVLRRMTSLKAKINISRSIEEGDIKDSKWYLERRDDDFKPRSKVHNKVTQNVHENLINALVAHRKKKEEEAAEK